MSITFVCIHFVQAIDHIDEFRDRVFAVALTDSVHSFSHQYADDSVIDFYRQVRNTDDSVIDFYRQVRNTDDSVIDFYRLKRNNMAGMKSMYPSSVSQNHM